MTRPRPSTKLKNPPSPLNESVDPKKDRRWEVQAWLPNTGAPGTFHQYDWQSVPMDDSQASERIRAHEMGHVRFTEDHAREIRTKHFGSNPPPEDLIEAVMDFRIHQRFSEAKDEFLDETMQAQFVEEGSLDIYSLMMEDEDPEQQRQNAYLGTLGYLTTRHTGDEAIGEEVARRMRVDVDKLNGWCRELTKADYNKTIKIAGEIWKWIQTQKMEASPTTEQLMAALMPSYMQGEYFTEGLEAYDKGRVDADGPDNVFGEMIYREADFDQKLPKFGQRKRKRRPTFHGRLATIHRIYLDEKVFRARRGVRIDQRRGTVLVDASGSMGLSGSHIQRVLEAAPHAKIAMYAGEGIEGYLTVVAKEGEYTSNIDDYMEYGGNIIDGPCLEWLVQQEAPHIFISDMGITGLHDRPSTNLRNWAIGFIKENNITLLKSCEGMVSHVRSLAKTGQIDVPQEVMDSLTDSPISITGGEEYYEDESYDDEEPPF